MSAQPNKKEKPDITRTQTKWLIGLTLPAVLITDLLDWPVWAAAHSVSSPQSLRYSSFPACIRTARPRI